MQQYEKKCCRCGFCCLMENCLNAQTFFDIPKHGKRCPALSFNGDVASCAFAAEEAERFGIGAGCCISARCFKDGVSYNFATLPDDLKIRVAQGRRRRLP